MKKVLVIGGAGFVGSNLCERLVSLKEYEVYSLDNYFTGSEQNHVPGVTYIRGNSAQISELITFNPDIIFHLGEYSRVEQSFDDLEKVFEFNTIGTFAVLNFVRKTGAKLLYAGSSTKFGDQGAGANASPYAWSKSSNTQLVKNFAQWYGINYAITYFYNVYGKREIRHGKYATLIALFAEKMKNHEPLTVVSPGSQQRNFTHIDDTVDALILIAEKGQGDEYGIGNPQAYTVLEIAQIFGGEIQMLPARQGNRMIAEVKSEKTRSLGWEPKRNIKDYIEYLKKHNWLT